MARIFYSMAGEGRGHAARVRSVVEGLRNEHQLVLFASDDAYEFLVPLYAASRPAIEVVQIPGLRFHYSNDRLNLPKSIASGLDYAARTLPKLTSRLERKIRHERPELAITDFEPALPRAARRAGLPFLSIDHQHFLVACDLSSLPPRLRAYAWSMSWVVRTYCTGQAETIASSFFNAPLKPQYKHVRQVGSLLRPEIAAATPTPGDYVLAYVRSRTPRRVIDVLRECGREVRVYGWGKHPSEGLLRFCAIDEKRFTQDLTGCLAYIGAAGNQVLGEALFLGKPVFAMPESSHFEQLINAHFLREMGAGAWSTLEEVSADRVRRFLDRLDAYRAAIEPLRPKLNGTPEVLRVIHEHLNRREARKLDSRDGQLRRPAPDAGSPRGSCEPSLARVRWPAGPARAESE